MHSPLAQARAYIAAQLRTAASEYRQQDGPSWYRSELAGRIDAYQDALARIERAEREAPADAGQEE